MENETKRMHDLSDESDTISKISLRRPQSIAVDVRMELGFHCFAPLIELDVLDQSLHFRISNVGSLLTIWLPVEGVALELRNKFRSGFLVTEIDECVSLAASISAGRGHVEKIVIR